MMRAMHLKIVDIHGNEISFPRTFLRFFVGCLLIGGAFYIPSVNIRSVLMLMYPNEAWNLFALLINVLSALDLGFILLKWRDFRLLHDLIFQTKVIDLAA